MAEPTEQVASKPQRDAKGRLLPGSTANAGGRPKDPEWLSESGPKALKFIDERIYDDSVDMALRIKAAQIVSERYYGKPREAVDVSGNVAVTPLANALTQLAEQWVSTQPDPENAERVAAVGPMPKGASLDNTPAGRVSPEALAEAMKKTPK